MKLNIVVTAAVSFLVITGTAQAAQGVGTGLTTNPGGVQIAERLFTPAVLEPSGFVAICFATNLDSVPRDLAAQIIDSRGAEVTETTSCRGKVESGATCDSTGHFTSNSPLRCVVGTSGRATSLRGGMTTSSGSSPFGSPGNLTVTAQ
jgi:hypothetical protein